MWPKLPIEFLVKGTPVSLQATNTKAKEAWKALVLAAAEDMLKPQEDENEGALWAFSGDQRLVFTMLYFPEVRMQGDVDNIVKLTMDALNERIYTDDKIIDRVVVQRFYTRDQTVFSEPSEVLLNAMSCEGPVVYIKIDQISVEGVSV